MNRGYDDFMKEADPKVQPLMDSLRKFCFSLGSNVVEDILEDAPSYGIEWELAMMEFGTVMIDIKSNYDTEDEGLMDEEIIPDWNKIKNVVNEIKKTAKNGS